MPRRGFSTLRVRLILMLTALVAVAIGVVYLYVVPTLRDALIDQRFAHLEAAAHGAQHNQRLRDDVPRINPSLPPRSVRNAGQLADARVGVFELVNGKPAGIWTTQLPDAPGIPPAVKRVGDTQALTHARSAGNLIVAFPVNGRVVVFTQPARDINATADLVRRRMLIAAALALGVAFAVGWGAAYGLTFRLARLQRAAARISMGEFGEPVGDASPDELGELSRAFDSMRARLDQADRARRDFIANASHELRTPLFALGGFLELLDDEDLERRERQQFLREMREQVTRLTKLASDLLDLSRLDAGAVAVERAPLDLEETARGLVREFRGLAAGHGSRVVLARAGGPLPHAIADEQRVQQIGRALVDNAIRHNPAGTEVRVAVEAEDGIVQLVVSDNGPGIDGADADQLFERFHRGDGTTASGSGLGLAIARELAERMHGSLELRSSSGQTAFALSLPAERAAVEEAG
jgi:signal transduction histidine kinase